VGFREVCDEQTKANNAVEDQRHPWTYNKYGQKGKTKAVTIANE
jgi:hypothetical protein